MKSPSKRFWAILGVVHAVGFVCFIIVTVGHDLPQAFSKSAPLPVLVAGRLAPFPPGARQVSVALDRDPGRGLRISFEASPDDIERWLKQSPALRGATPTGTAPAQRHYDVPPGDGAGRAEVDVDDTAHRVSIHMDWK